MSWIFLLGILVSLVVIGVVVYRKVPQLRVIDVDSILKERERKVKEMLILQKFRRTGVAKLQGTVKVAEVVVKAVSRQGRRAVQKLYRLEQYYQKLKRSQDEGVHRYSDETIKARLEEAVVLQKQEEFIPAEKIYIDIISHNPKSVDGYEALGNMYLASGQLDQARETFQFALRLSPDDASVNVSLAEIELKLGEPKKALSFLKHAVEKRSKNPRYLDYYIETALEVGSLKDAREGIQALKEVNPENKKIEEFEERFARKKEEYVNRTSTHEDQTN
ncbi:MAG: tetratricopeptide repeat protein [Candidatus Uhrbacteria bacterium]|nr:tetratricopeptide repeat protein [Candidatus Uhrbacteria bacterium]